MNPRAGYVSALVLSLLCALRAPTVLAGEPSASEALDDARQLIDVELRFKEVVDVLERVLRDPQVTRGQRMEAYRLLGIAFVARGAADSAEAAFSALLDIEPGFVLDPLLSPKIHQVFDRAKSRLGRAPRILDLVAVFEDGRVVFSGRVEDPDRRLTGVELHTRAGGDTYEMLSMERNGDQLAAHVDPSTSIPAAEPAGKSSGWLRLEYYVIGRNEAGDPIAHVADPANPSSIVVERPSGGIRPPAAPALIAPLRGGGPPEPVAAPWYGEWWVWVIAIGVVGAGTATVLLVAGGNGRTSPAGTLDPIRLE